jgi:hypothetical protein
VPTIAIALYCQSLPAPFYNEVNPVVPDQPLCSHSVIELNKMTQYLPLEFRLHAALDLLERSKSYERILGVLD